MPRVMHNAWYACVTLGGVALPSSKCSLWWYMFIPEDAIDHGKGFSAQDNTGMPSWGK